MLAKSRSADGLIFSDPPPQVRKEGKLSEDL